MSMSTKRMDRLAAAGRAAQLEIFAADGRVAVSSCPQLSPSRCPPAPSALRLSAAATAPSRLAPQPHQVSRHQWGKRAQASPAAQQSRHPSPARSARQGSVIPALYAALLLNAVCTRAADAGCVCCLLSFTTSVLSGDGDREAG
jgi:hypothetical protein